MTSRHLRAATLAAILAGAAVSPIALPTSGTAATAACADDSAQPGGVHPGGDWPSYGHDAANTRHQAAEITIGPVEAATLEPVWTLRSSTATGDPAASDITGTPVVADGCVYVGTNNGWVIAANADTGEPVWSTKVPRGGLVNSSITVADGSAFAAVSRGGGSYLAAFDQATGALHWATDPLDTQVGSDVYASPVVHDGVVMLGVSGGAAELGDESDRHAFQGSMSFVDAATGEILKKTWTIHAPDGEPGGFEDDFAGGAIWSTPAVDAERGLAYVGTGNPFKAWAEHAHTNAVVAFDIDRSRSTWGEIVASYKGDVDEYLPALSELPCIHEIDGNPPPWYPQGLGSCGDIDLDFGASPNIFTDPDTGDTLVGTGQKSGVYHVFRPDHVDAEGQFQKAWTSLVGPPTSVGGIVGSTAYDGSSIYGPVTVPGHVWSVSDRGDHRWISPTGDGLHWGNPVASANGVIYTMDFKGFLDAYDSRTGAPLLHRSLYLGSGIRDEALLSWGGVSVARNTVYAAVGLQGLPEGFVVALRPSGLAGTPDVPGLPGAPGGPTPPSGPGAAPANAQAVAGPASASANYATPALVIPQGTGVTFTNADIALHDFDSPVGAWPNTALVGVGGTYEVPGIPDLAKGSYTFICSIHARMVGTLTVV